MQSIYHQRDFGRLKSVPKLQFNGERKFTMCPECGKHLSPGEIAEQWCEECGPLTPREAKVA
jgi:hypothetical protein